MREDIIWWLTRGGHYQCEDADGLPPFYERVRGMKKRIFITLGREGIAREIRPKRRIKQLDERFQHQGYILKGYDAVYVPTMFEVVEHDDVIEIEELNSGIRFMVFRKEKK